MTSATRQDGESSSKLFFNAYRDDPLAVLVLPRQPSKDTKPEPWMSWKYPIIITTIEAAFFGLAMLIYVARDGGLDVEKWGGYPVLVSVIVFDLVAFLLGARIYLYFSWKSGNIFQALADKKVIDESQMEDVKRIVERSAESKGQRYKWMVVLSRYRWPVFAIVLSLVVALGFLYSSGFNPDRDEFVRYRSTVVFVMLPIWMVGVYMIAMVVGRILSTRTLLTKLFPVVRVNVQPLNPDRCGGLKPLLEYALTTSYLSAMLGFGFLVWAYGAIQTSVNGTLTTDIGYLLELPALWFGVVLYVVLAPVTFFGTLGTAHQQMKNAKSKELEELSTQFNQDRRRFLRWTPSSGQR